MSDAKERAWRKISEVDAALEAGAIDEAGWHTGMLSIVEPGYLAGATPQAQSGHSGDAARWESARRLILDAIDHQGTFLIGTYNEERHLETRAELIERLGFNIAGTASRSHRSPAIAYKALWLTA